MGSEWRWRTLGELTDNFDSIRVPVKEPDRRPGAHPYYGASGIVDHVDSYLYDGEYLLVAEDGENLRTRTTPIAFLARGQFWVNNHAHVIRGNSQADTRFLMYALSAADISGYLSGSTMPKLTQASLNRIPLFVPGLAEQRRIADMLSSLDDKIELNRRMSQTLESVARAHFKSWFVDFDPVRVRSQCAANGPLPPVLEMFPDSLVGSRLGQIPTGWIVKTIGELADVAGGSTPRTEVPSYWDGGEHHWATPKDLSDLSAPVLLSTERMVTDSGLAQISSGLLPTGTVLMSSRAPIGYLAIAQVPTAINQGFIAMKPRPGVSNHFLLRWAEAQHNEIVSHANGSTFLEIAKSAFRQLPVCAPPAELMSAFDAVASSIHRRAVSIERESLALGSLRDALIPGLMSGLMSPPAQQLEPRP